MKWIFTMMLTCFVLLVLIISVGWLRLVWEGKLDAERSMNALIAMMAAAYLLYYLK